MADKKKALAIDDTNACAEKLQNSVRDWLKETRLRRFVRDVLKISKLAKVHAKYHLARLNKRLALKWFAQERRYRESRPSSPSLTRSRTTKGRRHSKPGKHQPEAESLSSSPHSRQVLKAATLNPASEKMRIEVQSNNNLRRPEVKKEVKKRNSGSFKSPQAMGVNTISLNFGKRGDVQGQFVSESPPPDTKREPKAKLN